MPKKVNTKVIRVASIKGEEETKARLNNDKIVAQ